nr:unnamed protein product [Spirometra erinaceieuropaei]
MKVFDQSLFGTLRPVRISRLLINRLGFINLTFGYSTESVTHAYFRCASYYILFISTLYFYGGVNILYNSPPLCWLMSAFSIVSTRRFDNPLVGKIYRTSVAESFPPNFLAWPFSWTRLLLFSGPTRLGCLPLRCLCLWGLFSVNIVEGLIIGSMIDCANVITLWIGAPAFLRSPRTPHSILRNLLHFYCPSDWQQRGDLILVYKIIHGLEYGLKFEDMFQWHLSPNLRGHSMKLRTTMSRLNLRSEFFTQRVVEKWNDLPQSVVEATSLQLFKKRLDDYLCPLFSLDGLNLY